MAAILPASTAWDRYHHCCHNCCHCCKDSLQPSSAGTCKKGQVRSLCHLTRQKFYGSGDCAVVPYTLPFVGSTREYRRDPQGFVEKWTKKFGPVYKMHIFGRVRVTNRQRHVLDMKIHYFWGSDNDGRFGKLCPRDLLEQWLWFPARHASCKVFRQNGCMADCLTDYNHHLHRNSTFVCWWISTNTLKLLEHVKSCWTIYIETWRITSLVSLNMCACGNVISVYHSN